MKWITHRELSEADLDLLVGTAVMESLMRNKLVVKFHGNESVATPSQMGLHKCHGLYYMRKVEGSATVIEILFELSVDLTAIQEYLTHYKMGLE